MQNEADFLLESYRYDLPDQHIAQSPVNPPESAKLFAYDRTSDSVRHCSFSDLPNLLKADDMLFFNDSRVLPARVVRDDFVVTRPSGAVMTRSAELLYLRSHDDKRFESMVYPGDYFPMGSIVEIGKYKFRTEAITYEGRTFELLEGDSIMGFLMEYGRLPLPPYIEYDDAKAPLYQTVFASKDGSLAAPTASLHFSRELLDRLAEKGVGREFATLHVGIGTFKIMNSPDIRDHEMHEEYFEVDVGLFERIAAMKMANRRVIAVGTTMVRTLESLPYLWQLVRDSLQISVETKAWWDNLAAQVEYPFVKLFSITDDRTRAGTRLFIMPGYPFGIVDAIVTNFHLPESTLLCMIGAFIGRKKLFELYEKAIGENYRFYSFGDGMLIE